MTSGGAFRFAEIGSPLAAAHALRHDCAKQQYAARHDAA
jgi:hypothetical protein